MTGWRVDPAAVRSVLGTVITDRDGFEDVKGKVAIATGAAVAATPGTATAGALTEIANDPFGLDVAATDDRVRSMVTAVQNALAAFEQGDQTMAQTILHDAAGAS